MKKLTLSAVTGNAQEAGIEINDFILTFLPKQVPWYISQITSIENIRSFHDFLPKGSRFRGLALRRWNDLIFLKLEKTENLEDLARLFHLAHEESSTKRTVWEKWFTCISTVDDARAACATLSPKSKEYQKVMKRWDSLLLSQVRNASSLKEIHDLLSLLPPGGKSRGSIKKTMARLALVEVEKAETLEELKFIYSLAPYGSKGKNKAAFKLMHFSEVWTA